MWQESLARRVPQTRPLVLSTSFSASCQTRTRVAVARRKKLSISHTASARARAVHPSIHPPLEKGVGWMNDDRTIIQFWYVWGDSEPRSNDLIKVERRVNSAIIYFYCIATRDAVPQSE
jgi:hypothetical protein